MAKKINIDSTELLVDFKTAKNKREQINILADLHCCSPRTIAELLKQLGALEGTNIKPLEFTDHYEPVAPAPARPRIGGRKISFDEDVARRLFAEGVSTRDMAKALGVSPTAIQDWAKRRGLKREPPKGGPKPKPKKEEKTMIEDNKTEAPKAGGFKLEPREAPTAVAMADAETMTLGGFKSVLHTLLGTQLDGGQLLIDGMVVHGVEGFEVTVRNNEICVDLRLAEAG